MSSELAAGVARVARLLPEATRRDLRELVAHLLATGDPLAERGRRLALLGRLLEARGGELPSVRDYEAERERSPGEEHPSAAQLSRRYGGWVRAVAAAAWLAGGGVGPSAQEVRSYQAPYDRQEAIETLVACFHETDEWPTPALYEEWARLRRLAQRRFGDGVGRVPGLSVMRRLFGDFEEGVASARRFVEDEGAPR